MIYILRRVTGATIDCRASARGRVWVCMRMQATRRRDGRPRRAARGRGWGMSSWWQLSANSATSVDDVTGHLRGPCAAVGGTTTSRTAATLVLFTTHHAGKNVRRNGASKADCSAIALAPLLSVAAQQAPFAPPTAQQPTAPGPHLPRVASHPSSPFVEDSDVPPEIMSLYPLSVGPGPRVALTFFSDGYTASEEDKFVADATALTKDIVAEGGAFAGVRDLVDVWAVFSPSESVRHEQGSWC